MKHMIKDYIYEKDVFRSILNDSHGTIWATSFLGRTARPVKPVSTFHPFLYISDLLVIPF